VSEDRDEGGDPACWAHLVEPGDDAPSTGVDLTPLLHAAGNGVHWTLPGEGDLNANLVRLDPGHRVGAHVNDEVDVLVVVLAGHGEAHVDGHSVPLRPHVVVHLPRGAARTIGADEDGLTYLTVHRRRAGGLTIGR
jgi:quercetin dioxygenase-like cupin family protein